MCLNLRFTHQRSYSDFVSPQKETFDSFPSFYKSVRKPNWQVGFGIARSDDGFHILVYYTPPFPQIELSLFVRERRTVISSCLLHNSILFCGCAHGIDIVH